MRGKFYQRFLALSAAVAAVGLAGTSARAQNIVINDEFDDGDLTTNTTGVGTGWTPSFAAGTGTTNGTETGGAFRSDTSAFGGAYALQGISSKDGFDFFNPGGATVQFTTRAASVTAEHANSLNQFPGGQNADWRQEMGVVSHRRSNTDTAPDELYRNLSGGLYLTLFYDQAGSGSSTGLTVTGNLRAVNKAHTRFGDHDTEPGLETVATFTFNGYDGQSDLISSLTVNDTGFSLSFDKDVTFSIAPLIGLGVVADDANDTLTGNYSDLNDAAFTDEFINSFGPDAFVWAHGQNLDVGKGSGELSKVLVDAAQLSEPPPPPDTFWIATSGNWSEAANWDDGEPTPVNNAVLDNNGTITINQSGEVARFLDVGSDRGLEAPIDATGRGGTINVEAGAELTVGSAIRIGQARNGTGTLNITGGTVDVTLGDLADVYIGDNGSGTLTMSGGTLTAADELFLGLQPGSSGTLIMTGGTLTTTARNLLVGFGGADAAAGLPGATATFDLSGTGTIDTGFLYSSFHPGSSSTMTQSGGTINARSAIVLARNGPSTFTHTGGEINVPTGNGDFVVGDATGGDGTYNISGTATVTVADDFWVAAWGSAIGTVNQDGGSITANGIVVGREGTGTYNLTAGSLSQMGGSLEQTTGATQQDNLFVGRNGGGARIGEGLLNQSGGSISVQNHVFLGDFDESNGVYKISGGSVSVGGNLNVGAALASNAAPDDTRSATGGQALDAKGHFIVSGSGATAIDIGGHLRANAGDRARTGTANQSNLGFEIFDATGTSLINVAQNADIDGAVIDIDLMSGFTPASTQVFNLAHAAAFGATGAGSTNVNGSSGMGAALHSEDAGLFTVAVLPDATGQMLQASTGTIAVNTIRGSGAAVIAGTVQVQQNGTSAGTSKVDRIDIRPDAKLDLTDNKLITNDAPGTATAGVYDGLQGKVQSAYNFTNWDRPGLTTSMPAAKQGLTTIGISTGKQIRGLGETDTALWGGQTITGASTLAMYTYAGDANLDGQIDAGDYGIIDNFVQIDGASGYGNGDFNYDGFIDAGDYGIIDNNVQAQGAPFSTSGTAAPVALSGVTAVPEPASVVVMLLAPLAYLARRSRR